MLTYFFSGGIFQAAYKWNLWWSGPICGYFDFHKITNQGHLYIQQSLGRKRVQNPAFPLQTVRLLVFLCHLWPIEIHTSCEVINWKFLLLASGGAVPVGYNQKLARRAKNSSENDLRRYGEKLSKSTLNTRKGKHVPSDLVTRANNNSWYQRVLFFTCLSFQLQGKGPVWDAQLPFFDTTTRQVKTSSR